MNENEKMKSMHIIHEGLGLVKPMAQRFYVVYFKSRIIIPENQS
jgi:hypothetical protein